MRLLTAAIFLVLAAVLAARSEARPIGKNSTDPKTLAAGPKVDAEHGIKEIIPQEFRERYNKWKAELLSTEFGRGQWAKYESSETFLLKIIVASDKKFGAGTGDFKWDDNGRLVGATITLGKNLDRGFPDPVYYPVMNSLSILTEPAELKGNILASAKMAHELGHVGQTSEADGRVFQKQEALMTAYYKIFLNNGYNTRDPHLVELAQDLGRAPIEIWEDREYWGEANALRFLVARMNKEYSAICPVLGNIMRNVNIYAPSYEYRFGQIAVAALPADTCRY
jgi:hypothetical protein